MPIRSFRSLSWTSVKNYLSVELSQLSARGYAKQNARSLDQWLPTELLATISVWFVPSIRIFLAKAVVMLQQKYAPFWTSLKLSAY